MRISKALLFLCLLTSLISCQDNKAKQQYDKDKKAVESEIGKMIENSKQVAEDAAVKAQEQAEEVAIIIEDTAADITEGAVEVQEDLEDAINN